MTTIKRSIQLSFLSIMLLNCNSKEEKFSIHGTIENTKDSTAVYLMDSNSLPLDTTFIINKNFVFEGVVKEPTIYFILIKETMDFKSIWVENTKIEFVGESKKFNSAKISGSKTQDIQNLLNQKLMPLRKELAPINKIYGSRFYKYPDSIFNDSIRFKFFEGKVKENNIIKEFIREYPNTLVSIKALNDLKTVFKKKEASELYNLMKDEFKNTSHGKSIDTYINTSKNLKLGNKYFNFEQTNSEGKLIRFSDYMGQEYTLIEFWASWCGPCRISNPSLVNSYKIYRNKGFEVIGVSLDKEKERWLKAIKEDNLPWLNVSDLKGYENEVALAYDVSELPNSILLNKKGVIIAIGLRGGDLKKKLDELFQN